MKCNRQASFALIVLSFLLTFSNEVHAQANVVGTWACNYDYQGTAFLQQNTFTQSGNTVGGTGGDTTGNTNYTWSISGNVSGNQLTFTTAYNGLFYGATSIAAVNDDAMSGTWSGGFNGNFTQSGTFSCNRVGDKRATAISLFCNRVGVNLETARCSVTVADAGAPPRSLPTGNVTLAASDGFSPSSANCALQQTTFSPGIGSCQVEFSIPNGFPIITAFPIDATYPGDATFASSSTSHQLIKASCVSQEVLTPCKVEAALTFQDYPELVQNTLTTYALCGDGADGKGGACDFDTSVVLNFAGLMGEVPYEDLQKISLTIEEQKAAHDALLLMMKEAGELNRQRFEQLKADQELMFKGQTAINQNSIEKARRVFLLLRELPEPERSTFEGFRTLAANTSSKNLSLTANKVVTVKRNSRKIIKLKLTPRLKQIVKIFRDAQVATLPLQLKYKASQAKERGKVNVSTIVNVAVK